MLANQPGATGGPGDTGSAGGSDTTGQPVSAEPGNGAPYGWQMGPAGSLRLVTERSPGQPPVGGAKDTSNPAPTHQMAGWLKLDGKWQPGENHPSTLKPVAMTQAGTSLQGMTTGSNVTGLLNGGDGSVYVARRVNYVSGDSDTEDEASTSSGGGQDTQLGGVQPNVLGPGSGRSPYAMRNGGVLPMQMPPAPQRLHWTFGDWNYSSGQGWSDSRRLLPDPRGPGQPSSQSPADSSGTAGSGSGGAAGTGGGSGTGGGGHGRVYTTQGFTSFRSHRWVGDSKNSMDKK